MAIRTNIEVLEGRFFITFTCYNWLPLFEAINGYDVVYWQFDILKSEGHAIIGYVIMPNHVHAVIDFSHSVKNINKRVGTMKRFMAYEIVSRLQVQEQAALLHRLKQGVNDTGKKKGKLHEVFEPSFDAKQCLSDAFTEQKLQYIHNNPCSKKWRLSDLPEEYIHSSASFYLSDITGVYEVHHYLR